MLRFQKFLRTVACLVAMAFCILNVVVAPAQAALVGTSDILTSRENDDAREKVMLFLERKDVAAHLFALGVARDEARARVKTMTPGEINLLAGEIDKLPAGGDPLGFIVGVAFVAFVVLIITDIIGVTDIFTFIKKR